MNSMRCGGERQACHARSGENAQGALETGSSLGIPVFLRSQLVLSLHHPARSICILPLALRHPVKERGTFVTAFGVEWVGVAFGWDSSEQRGAGYAWPQAGEENRHVDPVGAFPQDIGRLDGIGPETRRNLPFPIGTTHKHPTILLGRKGLHFKVATSNSNGGACCTFETVWTSLVSRVNNYFPAFGCLVRGTPRKFAVGTES